MSTATSDMVGYAGGLTQRVGKSLRTLWRKLPESMVGEEVGKEGGCSEHRAGPGNNGKVALQSSQSASLSLG